VNDTYRSQLCLLYPPHLIAIAAIYLTFILHPPTRPEPSQPSDQDILTENSLEHSAPVKQPRRSSRQANHASLSAPVSPKKPQDPIAFLSELNVSLPLIATIAQEIISLYTLWDQYKEDVSPDASKLTRELTNSPMPSGSSPKKSGTNSRTESIRASTSGAGTPGADGRDEPVETMNVADDNFITPSFLSSILQRMREERLMDNVPATTTSRSVAINKRLERTQAVG